MSVELNSSLDPSLKLVPEKRDAAPLGATPLYSLLRCFDCLGTLGTEWNSDSPSQPALGGDGVLACTECGARYPIIAGTVRMLAPNKMPELWHDYPGARETLRRAGILRPTKRRDSREDVRRQTADSFAYEWQRFGSLREEWSKNFADYMQPHAPESFAGRLVLDVGTGSGRHSYHAAQLGADVVAVDLGRSIDVARANLPPQVLTVQADAEQLPLARGAFDFVMSIGVLHHLPDPEAGLRAIVPFAKPGGTVHVYLYWMPEIGWQSKVLRGVSWARQYTVRLPHRILHALCYPLAAALGLVFVWPYRAMRERPHLAGLAAGMPLKTYADYPFGVLVNDQFDRLSAPLERRYSRSEVAELLERAGLTGVQVLPNFGWLGDGQTSSTL